MLVKLLYIVKKQQTQVRKKGKLSLKYKAYNKEYPT